MINIYILQPPFWVSLIFYFFHWNAQVSVKVSMISVLGKIKEMCLVLYLSFVLFDLILYVPSTIFQLYRDGSSWVEPVLS